MKNFHPPEPKTQDEKENVVRETMGLKSRKGAHGVHIKHHGNGFKVSAHDAEDNVTNSSDHDHLNHAFSQAMQYMAGEPDKDGD